MNNSFKNILVAIDGSEHAESALNHAIFLSQLMNSRVTILQVLPPSIEYYPDDPAIEEERTLIYDRLKNQYPSEKNPNIHLAIIRGNPKESIVKMASDEKIDLIVMGATGKQGLQKVLLGSTTAYVTNHAHCHVLTIR